MGNVGFSNDSNAYRDIVVVFEKAKEEPHHCANGKEE